MRKVALILVLCAYSPLCWQPLRGQSPRARKEASNKRKNVSADSPDKPTADQRGTKNSPLIVDTEGHQDSPAEAEAKAREKEDKHSVDAWTLRWAGIAAGATVVLMFVGIGGTIAAVRTLRAIKRQAELMKRQAILMAGQLNEMKDAGIQADKHLMATERPWIGTGEFMSGSMQPAGPNRMVIDASVSLRNTGRSVAMDGLMLPFLISSRAIQEGIETSWAATERQMDARTDTNWESGFVLRPGVTHWHPVSMETDMPLSEISVGNCWILVCIIYRDQFGKTHRTQDCFRVSIGVGSVAYFETIPAHQKAD